MTMYNLCELLFAIPPLPTSVVPTNRDLEGDVLVVPTYIALVYNAPQTQSVVPTNCIVWSSMLVPTYHSSIQCGRIGVERGEGPGEEGLRWYPVLAPAAAKQDTTSSFIRGLYHPRVVSLITILIS